MEYSVLNAVFLNRAKNEGKIIIGLAIFDINSCLIHRFQIFLDRRYYIASFRGFYHKF